jgi:CHAT domain-containing protein
MTVASLDGLLRQLQVNLAAALSTGPQAPVARNLTTLAQRILRRLYAVLLEPLEQRIRGHRRLVIVPYGALHYLPFHLLHTGEQYLIECYEIVVLPASGLMTRRVPTCPCGALILAHSWEGRLPQTHAEARIVQQLFGGTVYSDHMARRTVLQAQPTQILHIAAHGAHRLDQPDLSYIQLADGQLYTDDLLQHDLGYELVTLSACETGRANVGAGDELIGLGRGFLYAGAGALITSLWRITDESAVALMEQVYHALADGASKAAALRDAQRAMLSATPQLHPAFWGAFQLVGDARPLSAHVASRKEHPDDEP